MTSEAAGPASSLLALLLVVGQAQAQETWIAPERLGNELGAQVAVKLVSEQDGLDGSSASRGVPSLRFECVDRNGARPLLPGAGAHSTARVSLRAPGSAWLAWASVPAIEVLDPARFEAVLREAGLDSILAAREALGEGGDGRPIRERSSRCAKALLEVSPSADNAVLPAPPRAAEVGPVARVAEWPGSEPLPVSRPLGLALELVPLDEPKASPETPAAPTVSLFRLLLGGRPVAGALVRARRLATLAPQAAASVAVDLDASSARGWPPGLSVITARTDVDGVARLELRGGGPWLLAATQMRDLRFEGQGPDAGSDGRPAADYERFETSLVIEFPAG